jgi:hypothetical protein
MVPVDVDMRADRDAWQEKYQALHAEFKEVSESRDFYRDAWEKLCTNVDGTN